MPDDLVLDKRNQFDVDSGYSNDLWNYDNGIATPIQPEVNGANRNSKWKYQFRTINTVRIIGVVPQPDGTFDLTDSQIKYKVWEMRAGGACSCLTQRLGVHVMEDPTASHKFSANNNANTGFVVGTESMQSDSSQPTFNLSIYTPLQLAPNDVVRGDKIMTRQTKMVPIGPNTFEQRATYLESKVQYNDYIILNGSAYTKSNMDFVSAKQWSDIMLAAQQDAEAIAANNSDVLQSVDLWDVHQSDGSPSSGGFSQTAVSIASSGGGMGNSATAAISSAASSGSSSSNGSAYGMSMSGFMGGMGFGTFGGSSGL